MLKNENCSNDKPFYKMEYEYKCLPSKFKFITNVVSLYKFKGLKILLRKTILYFTLLLCNALIASSQSLPHNLLVDGVGKDSFLKLTKIPTQFLDIATCNQSLNQAKKKLYSMGYLCLQIDSLNQIDSNTHISVQLNQAYQWASLKNKNIPTPLINQLHLTEKNYFNQTIQISKLQNLFDGVIEYFENRGYPFASIQLDSVSSENNKISAILSLDKGPEIRLDTILLNDDSPVTYNFITQYLGIRKGALYNESKIKSINKRISELSFIQASAPWRMDFTSTKNKLNLYLKPKSANRADVLIGMQPNTEETGGKFLLTGDVKLAFVNALSLGESLQLNWQNLQYKSPRYDVNVSIPYLLGTSIGASGTFDFYKKDTSFRTIHGELGAFYQLDANNRLKLYYQLSSSRLGTVNVENLIATRELPSNADITYKTIGSEIIYQNLNYKLNPTKGYKVVINASVSFRTMLRNTTIENTIDPVSQKKFSYLYDTLQMKNYKYNLTVQANYYFPLTKRLAMASIYQAGIAYSSSNLFKNELYQIGGSKLLRGFDEASLFVNQYHVFTLEPHYLISSNSYFFVFSDIGYIHVRYLDKLTKDTPYSLGLGMSFETKSGIFNLSYGVGKNQYQDFEFKNSKIHFGYINLF